MTQPYDNTNVHSGDSILEDVYVYGKFNYDFSGDSPIFDNVYIKNNLYVGGISTFVGITTFKDDVFIDGDLSITGLLDINFLTVNKRFEVGAGATVFSVDTRTAANERSQVGGLVGVANTAPFTRVQVGGPSTFFSRIDNEAQFKILEEGTVTVSGFGTVGLGTTNPGHFVGMNTTFTGALKLDSVGPIRIGGHIYDSAESPGVNGYYLNMDNDGIRWIQASPVDQVGILVQDEGTYIPLVGTAQTFSVMNYVQVNSLGLGTDTTIPIPDPDNPTAIARIQTQDLWGYKFTGSFPNTPGAADSSIYRMSKVGIKNSDPAKELDITGELHVTGAVDFDSTLNVDGDTTLNATLDVDGNTDLHANLTVDVDTLLQGKLDVTGVSNFNNTTNASSSTSGGSVTIDG